MFLREDLELYVESLNEVLLVRSSKFAFAASYSACASGRE